MSECKRCGVVLIEAMTPSARPIWIEGAGGLRHSGDRCADVLAGKLRSAETERDMWRESHGKLLDLAAEPKAGGAQKTSETSGRTPDCGPEQPSTQSSKPGGGSEEPGICLAHGTATPCAQCKGVAFTIPSGTSPKAGGFCAEYGHPPEKIDADGICARCGDRAPDPKTAVGEPVCSQCGLSPYDPKWKTVVCQHTGYVAAPDPLEARAREFFNDHSPNQFQRLIDGHRKTWNEAVEKCADFIGPNNVADRMRRSLRTSTGAR